VASVRRPVREKNENVREGRRALLRLVLGTLQVLGVSASLVLLFLSGVNVWSLAAVVVTCLFTTVSVLLFGSRRDRERGRRDQR
jgi:hypothetical protein